MWREWFGKRSKNKGYHKANATDQIKVVNRQFSEAELAELDNARKMPITYDEDCPETTPGNGNAIPPRQPGA